MAPILIQLPEGDSVELPDGASAIDLAKKLGQTGPDQALAAKINGRLVDLNHPLAQEDQVELVAFSSKEGKEIFWHSSAHILAQAVLRLWPDAKPTIGPPIEAGFYYDFANLTISDEDFKRIEEEMQKIVKENHKTERIELSGKKAAIDAFQENPYKVELIEGFPDEPLTAYQQGEFVDLCRGPHLPQLGKVKAIKLLKTSGAYWRGDSTREMLTRIYAITYPDRKQLKSYLDALEEAKKRDHKILGPRLRIFSLQEEAAGMPFILPRGMRIWETLLSFWREKHQQTGYEEIQTPQMMSQELWERSGHWDHYRENMYTSEVEERSYAIKPMNCPGCMLYYKSHSHSYREFPLRIAEIGHVHRHEASGALSGLFRVRSFHQDDAHLFMTTEQIEQEVLGVLRLVDEIYSPFGLSYHLELSTRPEEETIGSDEEWEVATIALRKALDACKKPYEVSEGEGAFYGPKIDLHIKDALERTWQCGTIQLDMSLPERFALTYDAPDGSTPRPVMLHRAIYGSVERFLGILIEHFAGKFPLWLSPSQVRILSVADRHLPTCETLKQKFEEAGFYTDLDDSSESVSKKIRSAWLDCVNYILVIGDQEVENDTITVRTRDQVRLNEISLDTFIEAILKEKRERALASPFK